MRGIHQNPVLHHHRHGWANHRSPPTTIRRGTSSNMRTSAPSLTAAGLQGEGPAGGRRDRTRRGAVRLHLHYEDSWRHDVIVEEVRDGDSQHAPADPDLLLLLRPRPDHGPGPVLGRGRVPVGVEGAFTCEAIRAGILSVARGQWEESDSIGLDRVQGSSPRGSERNSSPSRTPLRTSPSRTSAMLSRTRSPRVMR